MDYLPTLKLELLLDDPNYVPVYADGDVKPINYDDYRKKFEVEVEVVQLNLNTGGMRVRFEWPSKYTKKGYEIRSVDVSIDEFFKHYTIDEKVPA